MRLFVAMIADRHTDPEPELFSTAAAAIDYARTYAFDHARSRRYVSEEPIDGWLYHARYSDEGDSVWVLEKEVDPKELS